MFHKEYLHSSFCFTSRMSFHPIFSKKPIPEPPPSVCLGNIQLVSASFTNIHCLLWQSQTTHKQRREEERRKDGPS